MKISDFLKVGIVTAGIMMPGQSLLAQKQVDKSVEERMEWFSKAKLGIFIHWGIYSKGIP